MLYRKQSLEQLHILPNSLNNKSFNGDSVTDAIIAQNMCSNRFPVLNPKTV